MLFGPIGRQVEVPWPLSGMSSDVNLTTETTELLSGEQSVYRAPISYKTYNMTWKTSSAKVQPIIDVYSGIYGNGPYYITDPIAGVQGNNLLPAKWAACHLLAHVCNGWGSPVVTDQTNTPEGKQVTFTDSLDDPSEFPNPIVVPTVPGSPLYFKVWGSRTGSASVQVFKYLKSTGGWVLATNAVPNLTNGAPTTLVSQTVANTGDVLAVKIVPTLPSGTLTLQHIDLAVNDYRIYTPTIFGLPSSLYPADGLYPGMGLFPSTAGADPAMFRSGKGVGPVQFTGNIGGKLDSVTVDRIGLSLDLCEVSRDPNN